MSDLVARLRERLPNEHLACELLAKEAADALEAAEARRISAEDRLTNALAGEQNLKLAAEAQNLTLREALGDIVSFQSTADKAWPTNDVAKAVLLGRQLLKRQNPDKAQRKWSISPRPKKKNRTSAK